MPRCTRLFLARSVLFGACSRPRRGGRRSSWCNPIVLRPWRAGQRLGRCDGDGDLDYFVAFRGRPNRFYRNDKGTFRDVAADVGLADNQETRSAAWGDFDADGDPDLFIGFADPKIAAKVYRNDEQRHALRRRRRRASAFTLNGVARQPAWIDYDGDGDLDLFAAFRDVPIGCCATMAAASSTSPTASGIGDTRGRPSAACGGISIATATSISSSPTRRAKPTACIGRTADASKTSPPRLA